GIDGIARHRHHAAAAVRTDQAPSQRVEDFRIDGHRYTSARSTREGYSTTARAFWPPEGATSHSRRTVRFAAILLAAYSTVLVAELVGDKLLYTAASLAARFRAGLVLAAMALAFIGKMGVAVVAGSALAKIPSLWTALLSAMVFFATAAVIWFRRGGGSEREAARTWPQAAAVSFGTLFLTEWGGPGQIAAAALAVAAPHPLAVGGGWGTGDVMRG